MRRVLSYSARAGLTTRSCASGTMARWSTSTGVALSTLTTAPPTLYSTPTRFYVTDVTGITPERLAEQSVVTLSMFNFEKEVMRTKDVMMLLIVYSEQSPESKTYLATAKAEAIARNQRDGGVTVRIGAVNADREPQIAKQFQADVLGMPLTYFLFSGSMFDRASGALSDIQVRSAIDNFVRVIQEQTGAMSNAQRETKLQDAAGERMSEDEENPMTLIQEAGRRMQNDNNLTRARELAQKAMRMTEGPIAEFKKSIGLGQKKATPDMVKKMKENAHFQAGAKSRAMLALIAMAEDNTAEAAEYSKVLRAEYPWAIKEFREIADAVARVEMMVLVGYRTKYDSYITLLKKEGIVEDPDEFYAMHLKLSVCHYLEKKPQLCVDELLKLIRAEPKLGKAPKRPGETTTARKLILLVFDALGADNDIAVQGRKKLSTYLYC
eukprot:PhM_4_TR8228/c0_g1_i2/m.5809